MFPSQLPRRFVRRGLFSQFPWFYPMTSASASEARLVGDTKYFTGKPCPVGHISFRDTSSRSCIDCSMEARRLRFIRNAKPATVGLGIYFDGPACKLGHKAGRYVCGSMCVQCKRDRNRTRDREELRKYNRAAYALNPLPFLAKCARRRARKSAAEGRWSKEDIIKIIAMQKGICATPFCRASIKVKYHVDHIMPLALGGTNWPRNIQILCPKCNLRKKHKHPIDWAQENGALL